MKKASPHTKASLCFETQKGENSLLNLICYCEAYYFKEIIKTNQEVFP